MNKKTQKYIEIIGIWSFLVLFTIVVMSVGFLLFDKLNSNNQNQITKLETTDSAMQLRTNNGMIQWRVGNVSNWTDIMTIEQLKKRDFNQKSDLFTSNTSQDLSQLKGEKGDRGLRGIPGVPGLSGPQGIPGVSGKDGINGQNGQDGRRIELNYDGIVGQIQYRYQGDNSWNNLISINDLRGENGKSAYEIWLEAGNNGSQLVFLNSLRGQKGDPGVAGANGQNGQKGDKGDKGEPGTTDYNKLQNLPNLHNVATSGDYNDLINKPNALNAVGFSAVNTDNIQNNFVTSKWITVTNHINQKYWDSHNAYDGTYYTIPEDGLYQISGLVTVDNMADGSKLAVTVGIDNNNGKEYGQLIGRGIGGSNHPGGFGGTIIRRLTKGQKISIIIWCNTSGKYTRFSGYSSFSAHKIGD